MAITALQNAVYQGDEPAEIRALAWVERSATDGQRLALTLLDELRSYIDPDTLESIFRKDAKNVSDQMRRP